MEKFIKQQYPGYAFTEEDLNIIISSAEEFFLPKGSFLVEEGKVNTRFYLIIQGVLRAYWSSEEKDTTLWFAVTGEPLFSSWGYVEGRPSRLNIVASSDCRILAFEKKEVQQMMLASPTLCLWIQYMVGRLLLTTDEFLIDLSRSTARERYLTFVKRMPEILQQVPLKEIAGYLGMTPQSLSRIRAEIVRKDSK